MATLTIITYRTGLHKKWQLLVKRAFDIVFSLLVILLLLPLLLAIALAVKLLSPGPVLYRWKVVGLNQGPITSWKFRTMVDGADKMKRKLLDWNEATGPVFKMKNDPRITPIGRILRRFSLDELPQLWSILKGDMSFVGPRPVLTYEWEQFNEWQRQKLSAKPGAVCLWHIRGQPRNINEWVKLDLEYIENCCLWLDIKILFGAVWYILCGKNC